MPTSYYILYIFRRLSNYPSKIVQQARGRFGLMSIQTSAALPLFRKWRPHNCLHFCFLPHLYLSIDYPTVRFYFSITGFSSSGAIPRRGPSSINASQYPCPTPRADVLNCAFFIIHMRQRCVWFQVLLRCVLFFCTMGKSPF